ncbi:hypothetical protein GCM10009665_66530 [Kitasatospora nipponensis]|uniref:Uncharacterized protein n=1 Tax=Kitasatospora nipponensis TaxID=258049 RepID=A0ABN1WZ45_9ACTN
MPTFASVDSRGHGTFWLNHPDGAMVPGRAVVASISEMQQGLPNAGAAQMTVHNVVPANSEISFRVEVDWPTDLDLRVIYAYA